MTSEEEKTLAERIAVMQRCLDGDQIEACLLQPNRRSWSLNLNPSWHWGNYDYRVVRKPREFWIRKEDGAFVFVTTADEPPAWFAEDSEVIRVREVLDE